MSIPATASPYELVLTAEAAMALDDLAARRGRHWRTKHVPTHKLGRDRSDLEIDRMGAYGEYACCALYGIPFNWRDDRPDGDIDGVLWDKTVQIKTTPSGNRLLLFRDLDHFRADLAVLALVDMARRRVRVAGWVSRLDFERRHAIETVTPVVGPQPVLSLDRLRTPDTLVPTLQGLWSRAHIEQEDA